MSATARSKPGFFGRFFADIYPIGATVTGPIVFFGTWVYCIATYGLLWGVGLGWLPAVIVAVIATALWPLLVAALMLGAGLFAWALLAN